MPAAVPTSEPATLNAGDTWAWTKSLPDYPAPGYILKYALQLQGQPVITLTATASGTAHAIAVAAAVTANYAPGAWRWTAYAEGAGNTRYTIARGTLSILPSALAPLGASHAVQMLSLIEAALVGRIPAGLETTNIDGQELIRIPIASLHLLRSKYQSEVAAESNAAAMAAGRPNRRTIFARFTRPQ